MIAKRATPAAVALVISGIVLVGCASKPSPAAATPEPTLVDPAAKLGAALSGIEAGQYSWAMAYPDHTLKGSMDKAGHTSSWTEVSQNQPGQIIRSEQVIGTDGYVKFDYSTPHPEGVVPDGYWEHFDFSRIHDKPDPDPYNPIDLPDIIKAVRPTAVDPDGVIHGTLNLHDLPQDDLDQLSSLTSWWDVGPLKCTVTFDRSGRLASLTADLPAEGRHPAADLVITAAAYGVPLTLPKPTPTGEAPAAVYGTP